MATSAALAQSAAPGRGALPPTAPAGKACFTENVRLTGYVVPRGQTGVAFPMEGYRISEVLVAEGAAVAANQELVRLVRLGGDPGSAPNAGTPPPVSLRAPAAGKVTQSSARVGALTLPGTAPLMLIMTDAAPDALVDVPSPYANRIAAGTAARILRDDERDIPATVRVPATSIDPKTQFGRARLEPASGALALGGFVRAIIDIGRTCGVAVPRSAIARNNDMTSVEVVRGGTVESRRVRLGLSDEDMVEVREGLSEGEQIVLNAGLGAGQP
ncbi:MAG: HlyD family secretion protein [Enterovirga sp.]|nr:HlyD family secretion protein [Enterovirga sp.]